jgi:hypothetical protein
MSCWLDRTSDLIRSMQRVPSTLEVRINFWRDTNTAAVATTAMTT